jgi:hypothetical protein
MRLRSALLLLLGGCAIQGQPPGGPEDRVPPVLSGVFPDSGASLAGFRGKAEFRFDEVISEGGQPNFGVGTGGLEKLVILSPSPNVPNVSWKRSRITVAPKEGWRPGTTYRIELLPGVTDIRSNQLKTGRVLTFSTGGPTPDFTLSGLIYDWTNAQPARGALIEAVPVGDTIGYRMVADSNGRYELGPLPRGAYLVYGTLDQNRNFRREPREAFDSVRITGDSGAVASLWTFVHDTLPPRIQQITPGDSLRAEVQLGAPYDPASVFAATMVRLRLLPDSTDVPVAALLTAAAADSLRAAMQRAQAAERDSLPSDSTAAAPADSLLRDTSAVAPATPLPRDSTAAAPADSSAADRGGRAASTRPRAPTPERAALSNRLVIVPAQPFAPAARYVVDLLGIRTVSGTLGNARGLLVMPDTSAAAGARGRRPGARAPSAGDSTAGRPDSLPRSPARRDVPRAENEPR